AVLHARGQHRARGHGRAVAARHTLDAPAREGGVNMEFLSPQVLDLIALAAAIGALVASVVAFQRIKRRQMVEAARVVAAGGEVETPKTVLRVLVSPLAQSMRPRSQLELDKITTRLMNAGRRGRDEVDRFLEEKVIFMFGGVAFGIGAGVLFGGMGGLLLF